MTRKKRIDELHQELREAITVSVDKAIVNFIADKNISLRTIREYIRLLILSKRISEDLFKNSRIIHFRESKA